MATATGKSAIDDTRSSRHYMDETGSISLKHGIKSKHPSTSQILIFFFRLCAPDNCCELLNFGSGDIGFIP